MLRIGLVATCFLAALPLPTAAAIVADQTTLTPTGRGPFVLSGVRPDLVKTQTITAGQTGLLTAVDLQLYGTRGIFRFALYDGDFAGGTGVFVGSIDRSFAALPTATSQQSTRFDVSAFNFRLTPGQLFTVFSSVGSSDARFGQTIGYNDPDQLDEFGQPTLVTNPDYLGGFASLRNNDGTWQRLGLDRGIQTFVDVETSAEAPLLPTPGGTPDVFEFAFTARPGERVFVDPPTTSGYNYRVLGDSPSIASAQFPLLAGDSDGYQIFALDGTLLGTALAGVDFALAAGGVRGFSLRDIDVALLVGDPTAFVTRLTFTAAGAVRMTQTANPISNVPEPATWALMIGGFDAVGVAARRRRAVAA